MDPKSGHSLSREQLRGKVGSIVHVVGQPIGYRIEANRNADRIDHLSIAVRAGDTGVLEIALNTFSLRNVRRVEAENKVTYREYERLALEALLIRKIDTAVLVEGWGELYLRSHVGIHQVHHRRKMSMRDLIVRFWPESRGLN